MNSTTKKPSLRKQKGQTAQRNIHSNIISPKTKKVNSFAINQNIFELAKRQLSIADVILHYHESPNKKGYVRCCFHSESTPSLKMFPETNSYYCFGCGQGGDTIDFMMKKFNLDAISAVRRLEADFDLRLPIITPLTVEEHKKASAERAMREANRALTEDFDAWERKAFLTVKNYYHRLKDSGNIVYHEDSPNLQTHIERLAELPYVEYLLDMMISNTSDFAAQVQFYKDHERSVNRIEQLLNA